MVEDPRLKKKTGLLPLQEKMGLDKTSNMHTPPKAMPDAPGLLGETPDPMGQRVVDKIRQKKGAMGYGGPSAGT